METVISKSTNKHKQSMKRLMTLNILALVIQITAVLQNMKITSEHMRI